MSVMLISTLSMVQSSSYRDEWLWSDTTRYELQVQELIRHVKFLEYILQKPVQKFMDTNINKSILLSTDLKSQINMI